MNSVPMMVTWKGHRLDEMDRGELVEAVEFLAKENADLAAERDRWRKAGDTIKYLMQGGAA